jgi:peptide/nickel transport system permease protein
MLCGMLLIRWLRCWVLRQSSLLSGAFIAEYFFNWSGLGKLTLEVVTNLDLYLVMASLMMGATMLIVGNLWADLLLRAVDPLIKLEDLKK